MTHLWNRILGRFRRARLLQRQRSLPDTIWLHLVASLEESGRGPALRPNSYQVIVSANDYASLKPVVDDLEQDLAGRLAAEACERGYSLSGPAKVDILAGSVNTVSVKVHSDSSTADSAGDTTVVFHRPGRRQESSLPPRQAAVLSGPDRGNTFTLWGEQVLVGRSGTNHLILHDEEVSRVHLRISRSDGEEYVEDLDSLNGTWVNGRRLQGKMRLKVGDQITLGSTTLEYRG